MTDIHSKLCADAGRDVVKVAAISISREANVACEDEYGLDMWLRGSGSSTLVATACY